MATDEKRVRAGIDGLKRALRQEQEQKGNYNSTDKELQKKAEIIAERVEKQRKK